MYIVQSYFTNDLCQIPILISNFGVTILSYDTTRLSLAHGKNLKSYEVINFPSASLTCFLLRLLKKIGHWFLPEEEFIQWSVNTSFWWHIGKKMKLPRANCWFSWFHSLLIRKMVRCLKLKFRFRFLLWAYVFFYKNSWKIDILHHKTLWRDLLNKHMVSS